MTTEERLAYADEIEHRALGVLANARAMRPYTYKPNFKMIPEPEIWSMPHPQEAASGLEIYARGVAFGIAILVVSISLALVKT
jgi:hypothetical protein